MVMNNTIAYCNFRRTIVSQSQIREISYGTETELIHK